MWASRQLSVKHTCHPPPFLPSLGAAVGGVFQQRCEGRDGHRRGRQPVFEPDAGGTQCAGLRAGGHVEQRVRVLRVLLLAGLVGRWVGWWVIRSVGRLVGRSVGQSVGRSVGRLRVCMAITGTPLTWCVCVWGGGHARVRVRACACACVRACVCTCVPACLLACVHVYLLACVCGCVCECGVGI